MTWQQRKIISELKIIGEMWLGLLVIDLFQIELSGVDLQLVKYAVGLISIFSPEYIIWLSYSWDWMSSNKEVTNKNNCNCQVLVPSNFNKIRVCKRMCRESRREEDKYNDAQEAKLWEEISAFPPRLSLPLPSIAVGSWTMINLRQTDSVSPSLFSFCVNRTPLVLPEFLQSLTGFHPAICRCY